MANEKPKTENFINGRYCSGSTDKVFENRSPVDGTVVSNVCEASREDVDKAVLAARNALAGPWGSMSISQRCDALYAIAEQIDTRFDSFLQAEVADTGKPQSLASSVDIPRGSANFRTFADIVRNTAEHSFVKEDADGQSAISYTLRKPKGVIAAICPWNLPFLLTTWKVAPALACGNTVVVKPSEETPQSATLLADVMNTVGIPPGVFNVVHGFGLNSAGEFLAVHNGVSAITFTGETRTGEEIMKYAATGVRDVSLELGGKNAALVFADCDMEQAVAGTVRSAFTNCGQVCLCTERVYVEKSIMETFIKKLKKAVDELVLDHPEKTHTSMGPLISHKHRDKVKQYFALAVNEGATVITGGKVPQLDADLAGGSWLEPTIWTGLPESSKVIREEIFGPCCHIQPFTNEQEAVRMANDSDYGLAATVWTANLARAQRVSQSLETGIVWINTWNLRDLRTPFGGMKHSGIGREGGIYSLDFYSELTNVCVKQERQK